MPASVRFSHQHNPPREQPHKSILDSWLSRRSSAHSSNTASHAAHSNPSSSHGHTPSLNSKLKGKERSLDSAQSSPVGFTFRHDADHVVSPTSNPSASYTSHEPSSRIIPVIPRPSSSQGQSQRKQRTSLLVAATDVLGLRKKLGSVSRKKHPPHFISSINCIPDIIEINAHSDTTVTTTVAGSVAHMDLEYEERERLRGAAAQSIGLDCLHEPRKWDSLLSFDPPDLQEYPQLPSFPTTVSALDPMTQMSATLPKFTPASSLLVYALAKQWKVRTLVLTSNVAGHKTHVHLFKSASLNEVEMERLEITEDSAMFLAEEEVGGRKNVIKLVGKDVGAKKHVNDSSHTNGSTEDSARAMWFLQFTVREESQHWIAAIKNAVLNQRSVRAGLAIPASNGGYGPSGDMDVIFSMRMRGILSPQPSQKVSSSPSSTQSLRSIVMNAQSLPPPGGARDILTSTRSRSPSLDSPHSPLVSQAHTEESFGAMGTNLLTMFRGNTTSESSSSPACSLPLPLPHGQVQGSPAASVRSASTTVIIPGLDLKISKERDAPALSISPPSSTSTPPGSITPPAAFQAGANSVPLPLQPPPRKARCHLTVPPPAAKREREGLYNHPGNNRSVAGNFGVHPTEVLPPTPSLVVMSSETLPPRNVSPGLFAGTKLPDVEPPFSTSSNVNVQPLPSSPPLAAARSLSPELGVPASFETCSGSSSSSKRWSRKIGTLPQRPAPPSGPPPSVPETESGQPALHLHVPHPYAADELASSASSNSRTDISPHSASSLAQSFWKRASSSSAYSVDSWSTSDSRPAAEPTTSISASILSLPNATGSKVVAPKRRSMPPPRPAPTHAPPPAPIAEVVVPRSPPPPKQQPSPVSPPHASKPLRASVAQRALRLSLSSPKPPPSTSLPPRPDEPGFFRGHRRSSSNSTAEGPRISSELPSIPGSPPQSPSRMSAVTQPRPPSSASSVRSLSIKQRLRILSAPSSASRPPTPSGSTSPPPSTQQSPPLQVQTQTKMQTKVQKQTPGPHHARVINTLDFDDNDDDDDPRTPSHVQPSRPHFGLGEHIMDINDPSFLSLTPIESPTVPHPPPRSPFRPLPAGSVNPGTPMIEGEFEFMALSPPPRRGSKQISVTAVQPEKSSESEIPALTKTAVSPNPDANTLAALSARGSVVSLGYITM
ncbi:hypothetical protein EDD16DRAFT_1571066 [Pisolithus croceorrhizus]|nr:hypothetical protein EDD16DRAFT_1571066 [Pisolithus croceorrhizus]